MNEEEHEQRADEAHADAQIAYPPVAAERR